MSSQRLEELLVVGFLGLLALSVSLTAVNLSATRSATISEQAATADQIGDSVQGDAYLLTYKNHIYYHSDSIEPAQTFIGYPYSEPLAERIVRDLDRQQVEYVIVPAAWVTSDGTIERGGLWTEERAGIFDYVNKHYERAHTFDQYVAFRRT